MIGGAVGGVLLLAAVIVAVTLLLRQPQRPAEADSSSASQETDLGREADVRTFDGLGQDFLCQGLQSNFPSLIGRCLGDATELWTKEMPDETEGIAGAARP
jgi:hypothetical protein